MSTTLPHPHPLPFLSPELAARLDEATRRCTAIDSFAALVDHCNRADLEVLAAGGTQGWRPSGPDTLALLLGLEVAEWLREVTVKANLHQLRTVIEQHLHGSLSLTDGDVRPVTASEGIAWANEYAEQPAPRGPARAFFNQRFDARCGADSDLGAAFIAFLFRLDELGLVEEA